MLYGSRFQLGQEEVNPNILFPDDDDDGGYDYAYDEC
jgi:hypothetical protein